MTQGSATGYGIGFGLKGLMIIGVTLLPVTPVVAGPQGGVLRAGTAQIASGSDTTVITQRSDRAIIEWQSYDVAPGQTVRYDQPGPQAAMLNRITGDGPSRVDGQISANGQLFLINPQGVIIGPEGRVDTRGGFVASTLDLSNQDFMTGGDLRLEGDERGQIDVQGQIFSSDGDVVLVAPHVTNSGALRAPEGTVAMGAGTKAWLRSGRDQLLSVESDIVLGGTGVVNRGVIEAANAEIKAAGGSVYDLAINQSGTVRVTGARREGGRILLTSGGGRVRVSGTQRARKRSGAGGTILIGGGLRGQDDSILNAATVEIARSALFDASGAGAETGGQIILWADDSTRFAGTLRAEGGAEGGLGGFAEVSGKHHLEFTPTQVALGGGTLLLDPDDLFVVDALRQRSAAAVAGGTVSPQPGAGNTPLTGGSEITTATLNTMLGSGNVILTASGAINATGNDPITWSTANSLTMRADGAIQLGAPITATTGTLALRAQGAIAVSAAPTLTLKTLSLGASGAGGLLGADLSAAALKVDNLNVDFTHGVTGDLLLTNSANVIKAVQLTNAPTGGFSGKLDLRNGGTNLQFGGSLKGTQHTGVQVVTKGDLTLAADADFSSPGRSTALDIILASTDAEIVSSAPASAFDGLNAANKQRYLLYSTSEGATTLNTTTALTRVENKSFDSAPPSGLPSDGTSRVFYLSPQGRLTLTADNKSREYGLANPALTFATSGLQGADTLAGVSSGAPTLSTTAVQGSDVGSYTISIAQGTLAMTSPNYSGFDFVPGTMTITTAPLVGTPAATSKVYGDALVRPAVTLTGFRNGDTAASTGLNTLTATLPGVTTTSNVGQYNAKVTAETRGNYRISDNGGTNELTITARPVQLVLANSSRTYGAANSFAAPSFTGLVSASHADDFTVTQSTTATAASDVGTYPITATANGGASASASNYTVTVQNAQMTVDKATLTLNVTPVSREYGLANPTFTATSTGFKNGDSLADLTVNYATPATSSSAVGRYDVSVSGTAQNYTILPSTTGDALTITQAPVTITANDLTKTYGQTVSGANLTFAATGLRGADTVDDLGALSARSAGFAANADVATGPYVVTVTGLANGNYRLAGSNTPNLTVTPASVALSVGTASKAYGDTALSVTGSTATGLAPGESLADLGLVFASDITDARLNAGETRPITASLGAGVRNYTLGSVSAGTATVTKRVIQATMPARQRVFGDRTTPSMVLSGFVNGDTEADIDSLTFSGVHDTPLADAGRHTITGTLSDNNYVLARPATGTLDILRRKISVVAPSLSKTYGDLATIPVTVTNLAPGHSLADLTGSARFDSDGAAASANVGRYAITSGVTNPNYELVTQSLGTLTVTHAPLTLAMGDLKVIYGDTPGTPTHELKGLKNGHTEAALFDKITPVLSLSSLSTPDGPKADTVSAEVTPRAYVGGSPLTNYRLSIAKGAMEVLRRPITIAATNYARVVDAGEKLTIASNGVVPGGKLVAGTLVDGAQLRLRNTGDRRTAAEGEVYVAPPVSLAAGESVSGALLAELTNADGSIDADLARKYDVTILQDRGSVTAIAAPPPAPEIIITGGPDVTIGETTTTVGDSATLSDPDGTPLTEKGCSAQGRVWSGGACTEERIRFEYNRAPQPNQPMTFELMKGLTSPASPTFKFAIREIMGRGLIPGSESSKIMDSYLSGDLPDAEFFDLVSKDPVLAGSLSLVMEGYVKLLMNPPAGTRITSAEADLAARYHARAKRIALEMREKIRAVKAEDDARRAVHDRNLTGIVSRSQSGHVIRNVMAEYQLRAKTRMARAADVAAGAGAATGAAAGSAALSGLVLAAGTVAPEAAGSAGIAAIHATNAVGSTVAGTVGVMAGALVVATTVTVLAFVQGAASADRDREVDETLDALDPNNLNYDALPAGMHSLIMTELMTGVTLTGDD